MIVEYCRYGNLHNYLLRHREDFVNQIDPETGKIDPIIGSEFLRRSTSADSSNRFEFFLFFFAEIIRNMLVIGFILLFMLIAQLTTVNY